MHVDAGRRHMHQFMIQGSIEFIRAPPHGGDLMAAPRPKVSLKLLSPVDSIGSFLATGKSSVCRPKQGAGYKTKIKRGTMSVNAGHNSAHNARSFRSYSRNVEKDGDNRNKVCIIHIVNSAHVTLAIDGHIPGHVLIGTGRSRGHLLPQVKDI